MRYKKVICGKFVSRPNRFIANVEIDGKTETVHVKNTGRCKELLVSGAEVYLSVADNPARKTKYDLIAVQKASSKGSVLINMDSQIPNDVAFEWIKSSKIFSASAQFRREVKFGNSRFDIALEDGERRAFFEVKGVTLETDGAAMFPDAPTERGVKHILELIRAKQEGYEAYLFFVIQMKGVKSFSPNKKMHPRFAEVLNLAQEAGVKILAKDCIVTPDSIEIDSDVPLNF